MSYFKYKYLKILNMHFIDEKWSKIFCLVSCGIFLLCMYEWMNAWMMHLYSALCIVVQPKRFTIMWVGGGGVSPQPPPVCSIHLDDATAATGHRTMAPVCSPHTSYRWRGESVIEPIKWMGIIRRPWLTRANGGNFGQDTGVTPLLFTRSAMRFLMTRESQDLRFNISSERRCFLTV